MTTLVRILRNAGALAVVSSVGFVAPAHCADETVAQKDTARWSLTGSLNFGRHGHTATLLRDGRVLVVGGAPTFDSAELYDPTTGTWAVTGRLGKGRFGHTATLLQDGRVLIASGDRISGSTSAEPPLTSTSEVYDPSSGTWRAAGPMNSFRQGHTATLLLDGRVLVAGGEAHTRKITEIFDPRTNTWNRVGDLNVARFDHTATLLRDGRVLVAGGTDTEETFNSAELYDPETSGWTMTGSLATGSFFHTATLLPDGTVLVAAGAGDSGTLARAELFDPATAAWRPVASLTTTRAGHTATPLPNGMVLVAGGGQSALNSSELYDPHSNTWTPAANMNVARSTFTATLLADGRVLVAGGYVTVNSAELYESEVSTASNSFRMTALFSDQAGFVQYIQLQELSGFDSQDRFTNLTLVATSRKGVVKTFTFPHDLPSSATARRFALIGTAHEGPPTAVDFALPPQFIPTDGGTLAFAGVDVWDYPVLPADGSTTLLRNNVPLMNGSGCGPPGFVFQPFTPGFPTGLGVGVDPTIEYYNRSLDHYFITSSQPDIDALDSGRTSGWERTGESFLAYINTFACPLGGGPPPTLSPVCRLYIPPTDGDSHFFSASAAECADARAQHPEFFLETSKAFYASLPDLQTGECLYDQIPVYRLWNGRIDSNHRYTTSTAIRDLMRSRGYIAEGYGPNAVTLCVGGGLPAGD